LGHFFIETIYINWEFIEMIIDFTKKRQLNETYSEMLASWTKTMLKFMYGDDVTVVANVNEEEGDESKVDSQVKFLIKGEHKDVKSYSVALVRQKQYLDAYVEFGKEHPQAIKLREMLNNAIGEFESTTGLIWPFKDEG
jgi:hypothetical protein